MWIKTANITMPIYAIKYFQFAARAPITIRMKKTRENILKGFLTFSTSVGNVLAARRVNPDPEGTTEAHVRKDGHPVAGHHLTDRADLGVSVDLQTLRDIVLSFRSPGGETLT